MPLVVRLSALALALVGTVLAGPLVNIKPTQALIMPNGYIVSLKPTTNLAAHRDILHNLPQALRLAGVAAIERDTTEGVDALVTQSDAICNLQRTPETTRLESNDTNTRNYSYTYNDSAGTGVDIYVIDSGVNINHTESDGRASWGKTFGGVDDVDVYGHGTHVAMTWATEQATTVTLRLSVVTISLHFDPSDVLDAAVTNAVNAVIHLTASADNPAKAWDSQSLGRAEAAFTVGATDINDEMACYSNLGAGVDIFAPGSLVFINNSTRVLSGTSVSTPHVVGLATYIINELATNGANL
ncbi:peptidase S8/S53 domain-containing protein [Fomes fomentarius]|nr:peptidase S8/S53 domain-containing protein [Fomes fomentarius]